MIYEEKNGFYQKTYKYHIIAGILVAIYILLGSLFVASSVQSNKARRQLNDVRRQLATEISTNRSLRDELGSCKSRLEQCHFILEELGESTDRDIKTVRDCIDIIEETRYYVACLSYYVDGGTSDDIYSRIDNWLETEGVDFEH